MQKRFIITQSHNVMKILVVNSWHYSQEGDSMPDKAEEEAEDNVASQTCKPATWGWILSKILQNV